MKQQPTQCGPVWALQEEAGWGGRPREGPQRRRGFMRLLKKVKSELQRGARGREEEMPREGTLVARLWPVPGWLGEVGCGCRDWGVGGKRPGWGG